MNVIVIAACQAGIAHSKMVSIALRKELEKRGHTVFAEEHGGSQTPIKIKPEDIKKADLVIFATAIKVMGLDRFTGICSYKADVHKALMDPKGTVDKALELKAQEQKS